MKNRLGQTPSQTVGPYFAYGLTPEQYRYDFTSIAGPVVGGIDAAGGTRIRIEGHILDGAGNPADDAMVELWQAGPDGRYPESQDLRSGGFTGFGRCGTGTDPARLYWFDTVLPGSAAAGEAPHVNLIVFARGLLNHLYTRVYFSDLESLNAADPVLSSLPEDRRGTLIAAHRETQSGPAYRLDIHLQGQNETVFFDL